VSSPFSQYVNKQSGEKLWAVKITPDNVHAVAKRIGGHVLEGPKGLVLPQNDKYIPVVVELWDYLVSHSDDLYSTFLGLTFEADYRLVEEKIVDSDPTAEWAGDWWDKRSLQQTEAEQMATKLTDTGFSYEDAKKWVLEVQAEALEKERIRVGKLLKQITCDTSE